MLTALSLLRESDDLTTHHPDHLFCTLAEVLDRWGRSGINTTAFHDGLSLLTRRYAELGLTQLLPLDRVMVAIGSRRAGAFGGFHHPNQGYRHMQMRAVVTTYGPLSTGTLPQAPELAVLDLLRAYAHDCLHYGSRRRYHLCDGQLVRTQYGINFRRPDGRSYSHRDTSRTPGTRNLGVVMEGACDTEARSIVRQVAGLQASPVTGGEVDAFAYCDVTGQIDMADAMQVSARQHADGEREAYLVALATYELGVNVRYRTLLDELGQAEAETLHRLILTAIISGDLGALCRWLDERHGPGSFPALFMSHDYLSVHDGARQEEVDLAT